MVELQATVRALQKQLATDGSNHGTGLSNSNLEVAELRATVAELQGLLAEADCAIKVRVCFYRIYTSSKERIRNA